MTLPLGSKGLYGKDQAGHGQIRPYVTVQVYAPGSIKSLACCAQALHVTRALQFRNLKRQVGLGKCQPRYGRVKQICRECGV